MPMARMAPVQEKGTKYDLGALVSYIRKTGFGSGYNKDAVEAFLLEVNAFLRNPENHAKIEDFADKNDPENLITHVTLSEKQKIAFFEYAGGLLNNSEIQEFSFLSEDQKQEIKDFIPKALDHKDVNLGK